MTYSSAWIQMPTRKQLYLGSQKENVAEDDLEKHGRKQPAKKEERWGGIPGARQSTELKREQAGEQVYVVALCALRHEQEE